MSHHETRQENSRKRVWPWIAMAVLVVVAALIATNAGRVLELVEFGKNLMALNSSLREQFDLDDVQVNWRIDSDGRSLVIEIDEGQVADLDEQEKARLAREIAEFALESGQFDTSDQITIAFTSRSGILSTHRDFSFSPDELAAPSTSP